MLSPIFNITTSACAKIYNFQQIKKCHSVFGIRNLLHQETPKNIKVLPLTSETHEMAVDVLKRYYLSEHVLVRVRNMDLSEDRALDEYLNSLLKQGSSLYLRAEDGEMIGLCVNFASSPVDPKILRNYAFYRQDCNTKDFLYFTAKLHETPNLWDAFKEKKIFEIKMLTVLPEYRRQCLAVLLAEKSKELARDQGYNVIRMDCINAYDYKIAERCSMQYIAKFPLHKLRGRHAPYIKRNSEYNRFVRVYVSARLTNKTPERTALKDMRVALESQLCE